MENSFEKLRLKIQAMPSDQAVRGKGLSLLDDRNYRSFLVSLTGINEAEFFRFESEWREDQEFFDIFQPRLASIEGLSDVGDLRFHSLTLYFLIRAMSPDLVVETGVAHGKSSAVALLAIRHNAKGRLVSFDLPPSGPLKDGSKTNLWGHDPGWLVPEYLRDNWSLFLGDSIRLMEDYFGENHPARVVQHYGKGKTVDLFLHDSLHTYEHVWGELETIEPYMRQDSLVLVDNLEMDSGRAFSDFCGSRSYEPISFGNLGGFVVGPSSSESVRK